MEYEEQYIETPPEPIFEEEPVYPVEPQPPQSEKFAIPADPAKDEEIEDLDALMEDINSMEEVVEDVCPECGASLGPTDIKCANCGAEFDMTMECPSCGNDIEEDQSSCPNCGAVFQNVA